MDYSSPFNIQVLPTFEPQKVLVDGPGIRNGISASLETSFRIDTREAGIEHADILIKVDQYNDYNEKLVHVIYMFRILKVFLFRRKLSIIKMALIK
jgi:hypothetical protein